jgi:hypothetical protein
MNLEHDFFCKLNINSCISDHIRNKIHGADSSSWNDFLEQSILLLKLADIEADPKISQLVTEIGDVNRIAVYRTKPNTCYGWHIDSIRLSSINMLIDGFDSMCVFGDMQPQSQYGNLSVIKHEPNTYYLLNVKKYHTVYNFDNQRYILSLGIPNKSFNDVKLYLKENNMLE